MFAIIVEKSLKMFSQSRKVTDRVENRTINFLHKAFDLRHQRIESAQRFERKENVRVPFLKSPPFLISPKCFSHKNRSRYYPAPKAVVPLSPALATVWGYGKRGSPYGSAAQSNVVSSIMGWMCSPETRLHHFSSKLTPFYVKLEVVLL